MTRVATCQGSGLISRLGIIPRVNFADAEVPVRVDRGTVRGYEMAGPLDGAGVRAELRRVRRQVDAYDTP